MRKIVHRYKEFSKTFESNGQEVIINKEDVEDLFLDLIDQFGAYPPCSHYDETIANYYSNNSDEVSVIFQRGILEYPDIMFNQGKRKIYRIGGEVKIFTMKEMTDNTFNPNYGTEALHAREGLLLGYQSLKWTRPPAKLEGKFDANQKEYPLFSFIIDFKNRPDRERVNKKVKKLVKSIPQINVIGHYFYAVINFDKDQLRRTLEEKYFTSYRLEVVFILDEIGLPQKKRVESEVRQDIKYYVEQSRDFYL